MTCRCPMCSLKKAGRLGRRSYIRAHIPYDEHGVEGDAKSKKHARKLRRIREKLRWKRELND